MNKKEHNTTYVSRPKGKPDESLKGKLNKWDNGYAEFIPQGTRENQRQMLRQLGDSSFYKTEGRKESSYSLHLNVDAKDCADPVAELFAQFLHLTEGLRKETPRMPEGSEGRMLLDNGQGLQVWLDTSRGELNILTRLACSADIERQLLQAQAQMNVCVGRCRREIVDIGIINKV